MTKFEQLESRIESIYQEMKRIEKEGTGNIQYAENNYFAKHCVLLKHHRCGNPAKQQHNFGSTWTDLSRIARRMFGSKKISSLTYEEANVCVEFLNECIKLVNKYEDIAYQMKVSEEESQAFTCQAKGEKKC